MGRTTIKCSRFFINYIDDSKMKLINLSSMTSSTLNINKDKTIEDFVLWGNCKNIIQQSIKLDLQRQHSGQVLEKMLRLEKQNNQSSSESVPGKFFPSSDHSLSRKIHSRVMKFIHLIKITWSCAELSFCEVLL